MTDTGDIRVGARPSGASENILLVQTSFIGDAVLAVFEGDEDVYSYQDKQGRRWVGVENFMDAFPTLGAELDKIKEQIFKKLKPELDKLWQKEYGTPLEQGQFGDLARFGKTANKGIRMFFDSDLR